MMKHDGLLLLLFALTVTAMISVAALPQSRDPNAPAEELIEVLKADAEQTNEHATPVPPARRVGESHNEMLERVRDEMKAYAAATAEHTAAAVLKRSQGRKTSGSSSSGGGGQKDQEEIKESMEQYARATVGHISAAKQKLHEASANAQRGDSKNDERLEAMQEYADATNAHIRRTVRNDNSNNKHDVAGYKTSDDAAAARRQGVEGNAKSNAARVEEHMKRMAERTNQHIERSRQAYKERNKQQHNEL